MFLTYIFCYSFLEKDDLLYPYHLFNLISYISMFDSTFLDSLFFLLLIGIFCHSFNMLIFDLDFLSLFFGLKMSTS